MNFEHVEDKLVRSVLMGDLSEDALCYAISYTLECALKDQQNQEVPFSVSEQRLCAAIDAQEWWNEEGNPFEAVESLKEAWSV